ncbi:MAG: tetratricopeptide repeat protein [Phycisphaerales bacterium]|nr:MAG: tetratricopeptide repeat protein [Phycisphaerales bacterium]
MTDRILQLKKLLEADPDDSFCLYGLAFEYEKAGEHETAIEYFDRALAADPDYCYAYYHKARSQKAMGDGAGAVATLRAGLTRAEAIGDAKAASEITTFLNTLS